MTILFIAMGESIHTSRWINQLKGSAHKVYLFPSYDKPMISKELHWVCVCMPMFPMRKILGSTLFDFFYKGLRRILLFFRPDYYPKRLRKYIERINPDVIHSLETQAAGYLTLEVKSRFFEAGEFPAWWHSNWGSDIFLFGRLATHREKIAGVVKGCDYYSCECERDAVLAKEFGLKGRLLPIYPNVGGFDLAAFSIIRSTSYPTSKRRIIMLKGYQGWSGRALVGLRALSRAKELLQGYTIVIFSNASGIDVEISAELLAQDSGAKIVFVPGHSDNQLILKYHSQARISIGLGISDAISISVLEAMAMGSFPIQSNTSAAGEWFIDKQTGFLVPPEDPHEVEVAIREALTNDQLVDRANEINWKIISERMEAEKLKAMTLNSYSQVNKENVNKHHNEGRI